MLEGLFISSEELRDGALDVSLRPKSLPVFVWIAPCWFELSGLESRRLESIRPAVLSGTSL